MTCNCDIAKILEKLEQIQEDIRDLKAERDERVKNNNNNTTTTTAATTSSNVVSRRSSSASTSSTPTQKQGEILPSEAISSSDLQHQVRDSSSSQAINFFPEEAVTSVLTPAPTPVHPDGFLLKSLTDADVLRVQDIRSKTESEENNKIEKTFNTVRAENPLGDGASIPPAYEPPTASELELQLEIHNYMETALIKPQIWFQAAIGKCPLPDYVIGGTREFTAVQPSMKRQYPGSPTYPPQTSQQLAGMPFGSTTRTLGPSPLQYSASARNPVAIPNPNTPTSMPYQGLVSYELNGTDYRLIIIVNISHTKRLYGIAIAPKALPIDQATYTFLFQYTFKLRRDIDTCWGPSSGGCRMVVRNKSAVAVAKAMGISTSNFAFKLIVEVASINDFQNLALDFGVTPELDLFSLKMDQFVGGTVTAKMLIDIECLDDNASCTVELRNAMKVQLDVPLRNQNLQTPDSKLPTVIKPFSKAFCFFPNLQYTTVGVFSYRIKSTDIRLTLSFHVTANDNFFGLYFDTLETKPYSPTYLFIPQLDDWKNRSNSKHATADQGVIELQYRNILVQARMSCGQKALLEVVITAV